MNKTLLAAPALATLAALVACGTSASADPEPPLQLVALGDSISTTNACPGCTDFPELYAGLVADQLGREVEADNRSIPGAVTADLIDQVSFDEDARAAVAAADIVVVTIGFNEAPWGRIDDPCRVAPNFPEVDWSGITDRCADRVTRQYASDLDKLLDKIDRLHHGSPYLLRLPTVYNAVIGDHVDPGWDSPGAVAPSVYGNAGFAQAQCALAEEHGGLCARMLPLMNGPDARSDAARYLADDHTHLNQAGHDLTAEALAGLGLN